MRIVAACRESGVELVSKMNLLGHQGAPKGIVRDGLLDSAKTLYGIWEASDSGTHGALSLLDKDVIVCDWHYERCERYPSVELFCDAGYTTWICPWSSPGNAWLFVDYASRHERGGRILGPHNCDSKIVDIVALGFRRMPLCAPDLL